MERIQRTITEKLLNKLPSDLEYIDPQWLGGFGIHDFLVERIKFELHKNLGESIVPPKTDWADMDAKPVRAAWIRFIEATEAETRLPSVFARSVIESAVGDLLAILVEPRKNLPDYLFGNDKTLDFREASERAETIVVYTHFGQHLPNYMRRKQLDFIDRERFSSFISQLDEKLTAQYSPLNWAQLLSPLFELNDKMVDAELLVRFFRDKNRSQLAATFERTDRAINQTEFIEMLSAPAVDHDSDADEEPVTSPVETDISKLSVSGKKTAQTVQDVGSDSEKNTVSEPGVSSAPEISSESDHASVQENTESSEIEEKATTAGMSEPSQDTAAATDNLNTDAKTEAKAKAEAEAYTDTETDNEPVTDTDTDTDTDTNKDTLKEPAPLWQQFRQADDTESKRADEPVREKIVEKSASKTDLSGVKPLFLSKPEPKTDSLAQPEPASHTGHNEERPLVERFKNDPAAIEPPVKPTQKSEADTSGSKEGDNAENLPMWKRFISAASSVKIPELGKGSQEKPLADRFTHSDDEDDYELDIDISNPLRIDEIKKTLEDKKKYYIKRFFKDDQAAFNTVIRDLAEMESWNEAGPYITKNIFKKNNIDPYSDEAVNFIDRLQSYFTSQIKK